MSIYVYTLRKGNMINVGFPSGTRECFQLEYLCRYPDLDPYFGDRESIRYANMMKGQMRRAGDIFENRPGPCYYYVGKKEAGSPVYMADEAPSVWYDCDPLPGRQLGYLAKRGRSWVVRSTYVVEVCPRTAETSRRKVGNGPWQPTWPEGPGYYVVTREEVSYHHHTLSAAQAHQDRF